MSVQNQHILSFGGFLFKLVVFEPDALLETLCGPLNPVVLTLAWEFNQVLEWPVSYSVSHAVIKQLLHSSDSNDCRL